MGCRELIDALRVSGDGKVRALRAEAEQEAARIRNDAAARVEELRSAHARKAAAEADEVAGRVLGEAYAEARRIRLRSERALEVRLHGLARAALPSLRNVGYAGVFAALVRELPSFSWKTVRVNPQDIALAKGSFPDAEVAGDPAISGGFLCRSTGDEIEVENTFEQRLDALWDELVPDLMRSAAELIE